MQFHTILTHESPDLDAIFCCYLLIHYGEPIYPGIASATIKFCPAGCLPDGKTSDTLEKEGILVVDMGGGRLDTHPDGYLAQQDKLELSAANLVASTLGVENRTGLQSLLEFVRVQDSKGTSLSSKNPIDHLVSLPNLIRGGNIYFGQNFQQMTQFFMEVLQAIETVLSTGFIINTKRSTSFLLVCNQNMIYIPPELNLKAMFLAFLGSKFLGKSIHWQETPGVHDIVYQGNHISDVLQAWALYEKPELQKLIIFFDQLKPNSYLLNSDSSLDQSMSLLNIVEGFDLIYRHDFGKLVSALFVLFDCILAYEASWMDAVSEYQKNRELYKITAITVVAIAAKQGAVVKVARWQDKADVVLYQDITNSNVSISLNKLGRLKNFALSRLAARLRATEAMITGTEPSISGQDLFQIGEIAGWFLHQSQQLLLHGSPKARRTASRIPFTIMVQMVLSEWKSDCKLPDILCPINHCLHHNCIFYALRLPNCFAHRENLRNQEPQSFYNRDQK